MTRHPQADSKQLRLDTGLTSRCYIETRVAQTQTGESSPLSVVHAANERGTEPVMEAECVRSRSVFRIESQARSNESRRTVNLEVSEFAIGA